MSTSSVDSAPRCYPSMQFGKDEHISACPGAEGFNAQNSQAITYPLDNGELILLSIIEMIEWGETKHLGS